MKKETWKLEEIIVNIMSKDLSSDDKYIRKRAKETLIKLGETSLDSMEKIMNKNSLPVAKLGAIYILKKIKSKRAVFILLEALNDEKEKIRNKACEAIGEIKSEESIPYLIDMLKLINPYMRNSAKKALKLIGPAVLTQLLNSILEGHIRQMQSGEAVILAMGEEITDLLIEKMEDKNNLIKALAIEFLGKLKCKKALEKILKLLRNDRGIIVKQSCIKALGEMGETSVSSELIQYLGSDSQYLRETAREALKKLKSKM